MIRGIYAIRDRIALDIVGMSMYMLMVFRTDQEAARYFADAVNDTTSILNKHPADYELIHVGNMKETGELVPYGDPRIIITGDALLGVQKPALVQGA